MVAPYNVSINGISTYNNEEELELKCESDGGPDLVYYWSRSGTIDLPDDTITNTSTLIIAKLATVDGGMYTCTVTNNAGSSCCSITIYGAFSAMNCSMITQYKYSS